MSTERPLNVATPFVAVTVAVPLSVPLPAFVPIATVMLALDDVTVLPYASSTVTTGCVVQAVPAAPPPGCIENTSFDAPLTLTVNVLLVAPVKLPLAAVRV